MKVLKTIEGGTVIEGICLRKKIKINRGGPPVYSVPRSTGFPTWAGNRAGRGGSDPITSPIKAQK